MTRIQRAACLVLLGAVSVPLGGCAREWTRVREEESVRVETRVAVFSEPPGADVAVNGAFRGLTPIVVPCIYRYRRVIYARERSYGFVRDTEERMVPEYVANRFALEIVKPGYEVETHSLVLKGQKEEEVHVPLVLKKR